MKYNLLNLLFVALGLLVSFSLSSQQIIWGGPGDPISEFAGGLNGWTVRGVSCSQGANPANAAWVHSTSGISTGGFANPNNRISSPSFSNGVALFDSDFLDNAGNPDNFNGGVCPVFHRGELVSPVINLSNQSTVVLRFNQYFRWYLGPNGDENTPPSSIEVSNNGGASWTSFRVNQNLPWGDFTPADDVVLLNISSVAANQSNVQFKFVFDGDAYFWMIDDVYLLGDLPENDLSMDLYYYPPTAQFIPQAYQDAEAWDFSARISNDGSVDINDGFLKVEIIQEDNTVVWSDSTALDLLPSGASDRVVVAPFTYRPQGLRVGTYFIRYVVFQPGKQDATPANNSKENVFYITDNSFWLSAEAYTFTRPGFDELIPWGWGSFFLTSPNTQEQFAIESVEGAVAGEETMADLIGKSATMFFMEVTSFEIGNPGTTIDDGMTNILVGIGDRVLSPADDLSFVIFDLEDIDNPDQPIILENGVPYKLMMLVDAGVLIGYDDEYLNLPLDLSDGENGNANLYWDNEFIGGNFFDAMPALAINLKLVTTADERPLPAHVFRTFPNPASTQLWVDLDFEKTTDVTVTLADLNGRVISYHNLQSIGKELFELNVGHLPGGSYLVRIATAVGTSTQKITILR